MAIVKESYYPGWVKSKDDLEFSNNFNRIINFYVFGTPNSKVSSSGKNMKQRRWNKDVWTKGDLRSYLLIAAELQNDFNYKKVLTLDTFSQAASTVGLDRNWQNKRDMNRIIFHSDKESNEILNIFFYIRCAFAHGRFQIYELDSGDPVYVLESVSGKGEKEKYNVKARMILRESTLIKWADTILAGQIALERACEENRNKKMEAIKKVIAEEPIPSKSELIKRLGLSKSDGERYIRALTLNNFIAYDRSNKIWKVCNK